MSILLYGYTTWTLLKCIKKRLDGNCTRMLQTISNKSHETAIVRPSTSHLKNHPNKMNKTCETLLDKQGQTQEWYSPMDPYGERESGKSVRVARLDNDDGIFMYVCIITYFLSCPDDIPDILIFIVLDTSAWNYVNEQKFIQCNPNIRELSGPDIKSLISGFGLFCLANTGSNLGPEKISLISGSLISGLH